MRVAVFAPLVLLLPGALVACSGITGGASSSSSSSTTGGTQFCTTDLECTGGARCRGGLCRAAECATRDDCASPLICSEGECVAASPTGACTNADQCPQPYLCDGFSRRCFNPSTGEFLGGSGSSSGAASSSSSSTGGTSTSSSSSTSGGSSSSSGTGGMVDMGGWHIDNQDTTGPTQALRFPNGTLVPGGGVIVVSRDCSRSAFQTFWHVTLAPEVVFLNAQVGTDGVPIINGGEKFVLYDASGLRLDGPTVVGSTAKSFRRNRAASPGAGSWTVDADTTATPGVSALTSADRGSFVSEWSDASGGGNYVYEFIELYVNP